MRCDSPSAKKHTARCAVCRRVVRGRRAYMARYMGCRCYCDEHRRPTAKNRAKPGERFNRPCRTCGRPVLGRSRIYCEHHARGGPRPPVVCAACRRPIAGRRSSNRRAYCPEHPRGLASDGEVVRTLLGGRRARASSSGTIGAALASMLPEGRAAARASPGTPDREVSLPPGALVDARVGAPRRDR